MVARRPSAGEAPIKPVPIVTRTGLRAVIALPAKMVAAAIQAAWAGSGDSPANSGIDKAPAPALLPVR